MIGDGDCWDIKDRVRVIVPDDVKMRLSNAQMVRWNRFLDTWRVIQFYRSRFQDLRENGEV